MKKTTYSNKRNATRKKIDRVFIENFRLPGSADLYLDDPDVVIGEIMEFNRENGYLPMAPAFCQQQQQVPLQAYQC